MEERFGLTWRRETKEMEAYALLVGKDGPKLKAAEKQADNQVMAMGTDGKPRPMVSFGGSASAVTVRAPSASLLTLVGVTTRFTSRPIVDETGIEGLYDFTLTFVPEELSSLPGARAPAAPAPASDPVPFLADAVKKYGLRIETRKGPIEMFVVTHIEKTPTEN